MKHAGSQNQSPLTFANPGTRQSLGLFAEHGCIWGLVPSHPAPRLLFCKKLAPPISFTKDCPVAPQAHAPAHAHFKAVMYV